MVKIYQKKLSECTRLNIGGLAERFCECNSIDDILSIIHYKEKFFTIGLGSNLLCQDQKIELPVIKLGKKFSYLSLDKDSIIAGAATLDIHLSRFALLHGKTGFEFMIGIPGTVGGAIAMNAGCYGSSISKIIEEATVILKDGSIKKVSGTDLGFGYRKNQMAQDAIFIEAKFYAQDGIRHEILNQMKKISTARKTSQPIYSNTCGSWFKNPETTSAWKLIQNSGCKNLKIGGAQVSELHSNFFINKGSATYQDMHNLALTVKNRVLEITGISMEEEVVRLES